jgi:hypothetical protein
VSNDLAGAAIGLLDHLVTDDHELVTVLEGDGSSAGVTRQITEWLPSTAPTSRPRSTTAASRCTPTCSASSDVARTLVQLAKIPVTELKGVGAAKAAALAELDIHTVLDLLTTYPRRYIDRTREARIADLARVRRRWCWSRVQSISTRPHPGRQAHGQRHRGQRRPPARSGSRSSTRPGASASSRPAPPRSCSASSSASAAGRR